jgi:VWFA-related protein
MRPTIILTAVFAAGLAAAGQQKPAPQLTFRLETNYVEVDTVVTDARGNFVRDLARDDFEILEDRKPQVIDTFSLVNIPIERADALLYRATAVPPDVVTNARPFEGRIYTLVLDANHVQPARTVYVKRVAREFIDKHFAANDLAAVVHVGRNDISQNFTSSKALLLASVDKFMGTALRSAVLNKLDDVALATGTNFSPRDHDTEQRGAKARASLESMQKVVDSLAGVRGRRKAMLLFSEGLDVNLEDTTGPRGLPTDLYRDNSLVEAHIAEQLLVVMRAMYEAATRANVAIYSIDPRGLASSASDALQISGQLAPDPSGAAIYGNDLPTGALEDELRRARDSLRAFADQTGGLATVNTNNFADGFSRIVEDNSGYYVLGYHAEPKHDGKFHEIAVRLKRPGLQVRARKGYYALKTDAAAAPGPAPDVLRDLLISPVQIGGLQLRASSTVLRGTGTQGLVQFVVEAAGEALVFTETNGVFADKVELSFVALDPSGKASMNGKKVLDFAVRAPTRQAMVENGLRFLTEFEIAPGRYQVRLAARDIGGGPAGSLFWDVEVPDFGDQPLTMSGLALTWSKAAASPTINDASTLKTVLPGPTTAVRTFAVGDELAVYAEVYDSDAAHAHSVDVTTTVHADFGTQVFSSTVERSSKDLRAGRGGYPMLTRIPLTGVAPGRYVLTVEARSRLGGEPVKRELEFQVR